MNIFNIKALTWGTVTFAIVSACLIASGEAGLPILLLPGNPVSNQVGGALPSDPTAAGTPTLSNHAPHASDAGVRTLQTPRR